MFGGKPIPIQFKFQPSKRSTTLFRIRKNRVESLSQSVARDDLQRAAFYSQLAAVGNPTENRIPRHNRRRHPQRAAEAEVDFPIIMPWTTRHVRAHPGSPVFCGHELPTRGPIIFLTGEPETVIVLSRTAVH